MQQLRIKNGSDDQVEDELLVSVREVLSGNLEGMRNVLFDDRQC
jgi:hypothetical protein